MEKIAVSVIVPVYKAEKFLHKCVDSILSQTLKNIELILVNDGSPDDSLEICKEYEKKDSRVKVINKENGGAASARNAGLNIASGEYIGFVDSDDYIDKDMYETLYNIAEEFSLKTVDSIINEKEQEEKLIHQTGEEAIKELLLWTGNSSLCTRIFHKDIFKERRLPEGRKVEDFIFLINLHHELKENNIYTKSFYNVVSHEGSVTRSGFNSVFIDLLYQADKAEEVIKNNYPKLLNAAYFFKMYCIYLFFVNIDKSSIKNYKEKCCELKNFLKANLFKTFKNKYLTKQHKLILLLTLINIRLPNMLYSLKNK